MKICFVSKNFQDKTLDLINLCDEIVAEYMRQGFTLTLRQLFYQMVSRGHLPNTQREYKRLGGIVSDARRAGLLDWEGLEDRTRFVRSLSHWESPTQILRSAVKSYRRDKWEGQPYRVEVWIEKDALTGVVEGVCNDLDVPFFSCRGYVSDSELYEAAWLRFASYQISGSEPIVLHLSDHDPSGLDMTRDIEERLNLFCQEGPILVERVALTMEQVSRWNPPPNPAKLTDSRAKAYLRDYGRRSWELDALPPTELSLLIQDRVLAYRNDSVYEGVVRQEKGEVALLKELVAAAGNQTNGGTE